MLYLLHAERPIGPAGGHQARHYLGCCKPERLLDRVARHQHGTAFAKITTAFHAQGIPLHLVAVWPEGDREDERRLKEIGHLKDKCPACVAEKEGATWSPQTVQVNRLPMRYPKRSKKHPLFGRGRSSASTTADPTGPFPNPQTPESTTPSSSVASMYPPPLGGRVSAAIAPPDRKDS